MDDGIKLLTNKEAAEMLRRLLKTFIYPRGCCKTMTFRLTFEALIKAIYLLENTPDEVEGRKE